VQRRPESELVYSDSGPRLNWNINIPKGAIKVTVENVWVTLTGEVEHRRQGVAAETDVRVVIGVLGVVN
jgi:osmotically-inducible protein OsmY